MAKDEKYVLKFCSFCKQTRVNIPWEYCIHQSEANYSSFASDRMLNALVLTIEHNIF